MKNLTFLQGMRTLTLTGLVCLASLGVSAQTKAKPASTIAAQTKAKTSAATSSQAKAKPSTVVSTKPKSSTAASTQRKPTTAATSTPKKTTAPAVVTATPTKTVVAPEPIETASESRVEVKKQPTAAFSGGTNVVGFGFGLVDKIESYGRGVNTLKPLTFSYERGLNVAAGPGVIGVGGVFSYAHVKWDEDYKISFMYIAAKGAYHYNFTQNEKLDTYAGLTLGYARSKADWGDDSFMSDYEESEGEVRVGVLAGARYYFNNNFGAHVELESGPMSNITIGLNYRF